MTTYDFYIDTDVAGPGAGTTGDPYSQLSIAWEAEDTARTYFDGDVLNFHVAGTATDTAQVIWDGITVSGGGTITVHVQPWLTGGTPPTDAKYLGTLSWSTAFYRHEFTSGFINKANFYLDDADIILIVDGIQMKVARTGGANGFGINVNAGTLKVRATRIWNTSSGSSRGIRDQNTAVIAEVTNNIIFGFDSALNMHGTQAPICRNNAWPHNLTNGHSWPTDSVYVKVKGDIFWDNPTDASITAGSGPAAYDWNLDEDNNIRGTNGDALVVANDIQDPNPTNDEDTDCRIKVGSSFIAWAPTNGTDSNVPTVDIRGNARNTGSGQTTAPGPFAASGEGAGGTTFEDSILFGSTYNYALSNIMTMESGITLNTTFKYEIANISIFEESVNLGTTFGKSLINNLVMDENITLNTKFAMLLAGGFVFEDALTLNTLLGLGLADDVSFEETISVGFTLGQTHVTQVTFEASTVYGITFNYGITENMTIEEAVIFAHTQNISVTPNLVLEANMNFDFSFNKGDVSNISLENSANLGVTLNFSPSDVLTAENTSTYNVTFGMDVAGAISVIEENISFGISFTMNVASDMTMEEVITLATKYAMTLSTGSVLTAITKISTEADLDGLITTEADQTKINKRIH